MVSRSDDGLILEAIKTRLLAIDLPKVTVIAVSGGRDSMLLARVCADIRERANTKFIAVTIDHALRTDSAAETQEVARWCCDLGLSHLTKHWIGDKPSTRIQERARAMRYQLLCEAADENDAQAILTAHTQSDQAETVLMRLMRGAGPVGLRAIEPERMIALGAGEPIRLIRPMLDVSREQVTDLVTALDQAFIDDPSNDNVAFERIRGRAVLAALAEQDILTPQALAHTASKCAVMANAHQQRLKVHFDQMHGVILGWGAISIKAPTDLAPTELVEADRLGLFARLLLAVGAGDYPPDLDDVARVLDDLRAQKQTTLAGCLIRHLGDHYLILREPAAFVGRGAVANQHEQTLTPGAKVIWDRRFIIENTDQNQTVTLRAVLPSDDLAPWHPQAPIEGLACLPWLDLPGVQLSKAGGLALPPTRSKILMRCLIGERLWGGVHRFVKVPSASDMALKGQ